MIVTGKQQKERERQLMSWMMYLTLKKKVGVVLMPSFRKGAVASSKYNNIINDNNNIMIYLTWRGVLKNS